MLAGSAPYYSGGVGFEVGADRLSPVADGPPLPPLTARFDRVEVELPAGQDGTVTAADALAAD